MRRSLITMSMLVGLGVVLSLSYPASGWAEGWRPGPAARGSAPTGPGWSPWNHRGYGRYGPYAAPYGPPHYRPAPRVSHGYGPPSSVRPGYPGRRPPRRSVPPQRGQEIWAPDVSGPVYRSFTSPPAPAFQDQFDRRRPPASMPGTAVKRQKGVGEAFITETPVPGSAQAIAAEPPFTEVPAAEAPASPIERQKKLETSTVPPVPVQDRAAPPESASSDSAPAVTEPEVVTTVESMPAAAAPGQTPATVDKEAGPAVAGKMPAPAEQVLETAGRSPEPVGAVSGEAQPQAAEPAAGKARDTAEEKPRSPVQRWLSPSPGFR